MKNIFYSFNNANVICPPMSYKFHISQIFLVNPATLTTQSELHMDFHEFEEKIT